MKTESKIIEQNTLILSKITTPPFPDKSIFPIKQPKNATFTILNNTLQYLKS